MVTFRRRVINWIFTTRRTYASAVLGVVIQSVCLSITCKLCDKIKQCTAIILIPHERTITLVLWHQQWLVCDAPSILNLYSIWPTQPPPSKNADFVSTVTDSENSSIMTNRKLTTAFRAGLCTLPISPPNGGSKSNFCCVFLTNFNFNQTKSATKFLCVETSSGKVVIQPFRHLMVHRYWHKT